MIGYSIGRIGCFLNGCCYGLPTNLGMGVKFPSLALKRYPTQLFTSFGAFIIFLILLKVDSRKKFYGKTFCWTLILYGVLTFFVEFLRDVPRFSLLSLTLNQYSALVIIPLGIVLLVSLSKSPFLLV